MKSAGHKRFRGHYEVMGTGLPLLCCAGFGCSNWIFKDLARALADQASWIMPDPRGMGRSPKVRQPYAITDLAQDGLDLINELGHQRFAVMGISMGGFTAQTLAIAEPERVAALFLLCTTGPGPDFVPLPEIEEPLLRSWYDLDPALVARTNTDATVHPSLKQRDPERYQAILAAKLRFRAELDQVLLQRQATTAFLESTHALETIRCPTLILTGENDRFVPPENSRILAQKIPRAQLRLFSQTDHLFFLEKTAGVASAIGPFLDAV